MRKLCQGCVMLPPEKQLHVPHGHDTIEKDIWVCTSCYNRISQAIANDTDLDASIVGNRIMGIKFRDDPRK